MKSRVPKNLRIMLVVSHGEETLVVRFRPDQREEARLAFIRLAFSRGWIPPFDHTAFAFIRDQTWEAQ
jgi:hypothetical protein